MYEQRVQQLKEYFGKEETVILSFIFGSRAKQSQRLGSDWDIAVYLNPYEYGELEVEKEYGQEHRLWTKTEEILQSNEVDFVVLNRARPSLVFSILNYGIPLVIKDRNLYWRLLIKTHYEAVDYWDFTRDFFLIGERAKSISEEDMAILREHIRFLESEFSELNKFEKLTQKEYIQDSDRRRNVERWVENLVMSAMDIAKIILASQKSQIPETYRQTLLYFTLKFMAEDTALEFSQFAEMRNIVAHEYLDIKWRKIKRFIEDSARLYPFFIEKVKEFIT